MTLRRSLIGLFALALLGCSSEDAADPAPSGKASLTFAVTKGVRANPNLVDKLQGNVYGAVFLADDVTLTGPKDGAVEKASVELVDVDLEGADISTESWVSGDLAPAEYMFLGFLDVDGNGADTKDPESGDPVTLPINRFTVEDGKTAEFKVEFDLVL